MSGEAKGYTQVWAERSGPRLVASEGAEGEATQLPDSDRSL